MDKIPDNLPSLEDPSPSSAPSAIQSTSSAAKPPIWATMPFVDLYKILKMPRDASAMDLQRKIAEMYRDAQKHLDHRNAKKKHHYQQLFEVLLPQARAILLEPDQRVQYDKFLDEHYANEHHPSFAERLREQAHALTHPGQSHHDHAQQMSETPFSASTTTNGLVEEETFQKPVTVEDLYSPEELAERRESQWNQWEESLGLSNESVELIHETSAPASSTPDATAPDVTSDAGAVPSAAGVVGAPSVSSRQEAEAATQREEEQRNAARRQALRRDVARRAREEEEQRAREAQAEQRRLHQYMEKVHDLTTMNRLYWGFGLGVGALMAGFALLLALESFFSEPGRTPPFGSANTFRLVMVFVVLLLSGVAAWQGAVRGAAQVKRLIKSPESVRREADIIAAQVVNEHFQHEASQGKKAPHQLEVDAVMREESAQQMRLVRRDSILEIMHVNIATVWSLGAGIAAFLVCSGVAFLISSTTSGANATGQGVKSLVGFVVSVVIAFVAAKIGARLGRSHHIAANSVE